MTRLLRGVCCCGLLWAATVAAAACPDWPAFGAFAGRFVSADGRVIDPSTPQQVTTSEGQSYALFFALVAGDRARFEQILQWTRDNLAQGDLTLHLPAWQWGRAADGRWKVLDANPAADADLWLAYDLLQAGRRWRMPTYRILGKVLAHHIYDAETAVIPGLGRTLLPAPRGFRLDEQHWRLNPSYMPLQLLQALADEDPGRDWRVLLASATRVVEDSAPAGFAPDWTVYDAASGRFQADALTHGVGSYGAIRVYLWAGMLAADDPARPTLLQRLAPMAVITATNGWPPRQVNTTTGAVDGQGSSGFSAALLPFLAARGQTDALRVQRARVAATAWPPAGYYNAVLTLFGTGAMERRFAFAANGRLHLPEDAACAAASH